MNTSPRKKTASKKESISATVITRNPKAILVQGFSGDTNDRAIAHSLTCPSTQAASTIHAFEKSEYDINGFVEELAAQVEAVNAGGMKRAEAMLITQAHTLNELFNSLARRACNQKYLLQYEAYMRIALKAQNQCRSTLEALAAIKNPPVIFVKQANIARGPQQINNGVQAGEPHAQGNNPIQSNKLSGGSNELLQDTRTSQAQGSVNQQLETVGEIYRPKD